MSHFTVAIIGDNPEEQLIPFCEDVEQVPHDLLEFDDWETKYINTYENESIEMIRLASGELKYTWDDSFKNPKYELIGRDGDVERFIYPKDSERCQIAQKSRYKDFETFLEDWYGTEEKDALTGRYGYWVNPNAKWDWYQLGGRWANMLKMKKGRWADMLNAGKDPIPEYVDSALLKEIDFEGMESEAREKYSSLYDKAMEELAKADKGIPNSVFWRYSIEEGESKEDFVNRSSAFSTFAVLKNRKWYEKGEMLYWAMVKDEKNAEDWDRQFKALLGSLSPDTKISIYDCHI